MSIRCYVSPGKVRLYRKEISEKINCAGIVQKVNIILDRNNSTRLDIPLVFVIREEKNLQLRTKMVGFSAGIRS